VKPQKHPSPNFKKARAVVVEFFFWIAFMVLLFVFSQNLAAFFSEQVTDLSLPLIVLTFFILGVVGYLIGGRCYTLYHKLVSDSGDSK